MKSALTILITLTAVTFCSADPIKFIHEGSGSGTLDNVPFDNVDFVITATGDTTNRSFDGYDVYWIDHDSAQIELSGLGTFDFLITTRTFVNLIVPIVGFSRSDGSDLFNGPTDSAYSAWDMLTSIGPHSGDGYLTLHVFTSGGWLLFSVDNSPATFTAVVVPEPSSIVLAAGSLLWFTLRRK